MDDTQSPRVINPTLQQSAAASTQPTVQMSVDEFIAQMLEFRVVWKRMWSLFWGHFLEFFGIGLLTSIITIVVTVPTELITLEIQKRSNPLLVVAVVLLSVLTTVLQVQIANGWIRYIVALTRKQDVSFQMFYHDFRRVLPTYFGGILFSLIVVVGYVLLLIPGIIWSIKYRYTILLIVDRKMGIGAALKESVRLTEGMKKRLFFLDARMSLLVLGPLLAELVMVLGVLIGYQQDQSYATPLAIVAGIGAAAYLLYVLIIAGPLSTLQYVVYETLSRRFQESDESVQKTVDESGTAPTAAVPVGAA